MEDVQMYAPILVVLCSAICIRVCAREAAHPGQIVNSGAGSWLKDPITNCAVWGSDLSGDNLISWSGDCRDGKAAWQHPARTTPAAGANRSPLAPPVPREWRSAKHVRVWAGFRLQDGSTYDARQRLSCMVKMGDRN